MKFCISILFLSFFSFGCAAQMNKGELISQINHDHKIDSLLLDFTKQCNKCVFKDSCIIITLAHRDSILDLSIFMENKENVQQWLSSLHAKGEHIGFFNLDNYKVFLSSPERFSGLFSETPIFKRFNFLDFSQKPILKRLITQDDISQYFGFYTYQNGKFTVAY